MALRPLLLEGTAFHEEFQNFLKTVTAVNLHVFCEASISIGGLDQGCLGVLAREQGDAH
jgi:hypothetical protein